MAAEEPFDDEAEHLEREIWDSLPEYLRSPEFRGALTAWVRAQVLADKAFLAMSGKSLDDITAPLGYQRKSLLELWMQLDRACGLLRNQIGLPPAAYERIRQSLGLAATAEADALRKLASTGAAIAETKAKAGKPKMTWAEAHGVPQSVVAFDVSMTRDSGAVVKCSKTRIDGEPAITADGITTICGGDPGDIGQAVKVMSNAAAHEFKRLPVVADPFSCLTLIQRLRESGVAVTEVSVASQITAKSAIAPGKATIRGPRDEEGRLVTFAAQVAGMPPCVMRCVLMAAAFLLGEPDGTGT